MLNPRVPLTPKDPKGPLRVLLIGRVSTVHQDIENIQASFEAARMRLKEVYDGPIFVKTLGERGSGMLRDRASIREAEDEIETGTWDLVLMEDLARAYRNTQYQIGFVHHCVDHKTRCISFGDGLDTGDEHWEATLHVAAMRHGMYIPDTRRRVKRTAAYAFENGGMVLKVIYGYRKLTKAEALSGQFGPKGLRICKVADCTENIQEMRRRVLRGDPYVAIISWLNDAQIPVGPYVTKGRWTVNVLVSLLRNDLLQGIRTFPRVKNELIFGTGEHRREKNPNPKTVEYPELAHMTADEQIEMWEAMDQRNKRKTSDSHPRSGVSRYQSLWPGQHLRCGICNGVMYWATATQLKCQHASPGSPDRKCWNQVLVNAENVRTQLLPALIETLSLAPEFRNDLLNAAWEELQLSTSKSRRQVEESERRLKNLRIQSKNVTGLLAERPDSESLKLQLDSIDAEIEACKATLEQAKNSTHDTVNCVDRGELNERLTEIIVHLSRTSFDFSLLMRRTFLDFCVLPVQALDSSQVHPRVKLRLPSSIAELVGTEQVAVDAFTSPQHIQYLTACKTLFEERKLTYRQAGVHLGVNYMTVKRTLAYLRLMRSRQTTDPYVVLTERPEKAARWRKQSLKAS